MVSGALLLYLRVLMPRHRRWGVSDAEARMTFPGDELVADPQYVVDRGITIDAGPQHIWPWLVQMGNGRGGLYSWDWLDRLFGVLDHPSARQILPEFQDLAAGDVIPAGRGGDFPVAVVEPRRALVMAGGEGGIAWSWALVLEPLGAGRTKLISRNRGRFPATPWMRVFIVVLDLQALIMTRRMLVNLKHRAERLARNQAQSR